MKDIELKLKGLKSNMDNMSIRQINKDLADIKKDVIKYKFNNDVNDYMDYSLYKLQGLFEVDIFDMSYKQICKHIEKIINIVEFLEE